MRSITNGHKRPLTAILGCVHGDEEIGLWVLNQLINFYPKKGSIKYIIANEAAACSDKRFLDSDLNRSFPGNLNGNHEQQLAYALMQELSYCDYVLDIHSTTADTDDFIITAGESDLASHFPLSKVVNLSGVMQRNSLIEHVKNGISIEYNRSTIQLETVENQILQCLVNLGISSGTKMEMVQEHYFVYGLLKKNYRKSRCRVH